MQFFRKLSTLWRKNELDADMAEELRLHLEQRTRENIAAGMNPDEAQYAAQRQFGNLAAIQEQAREVRGWVWLEQSGKNLYFAARSLAKSPAFTVTALATLALCLGANLAIFAVVDAVLLRPLPFPEARELVTMFNTYPKAGVLNDGSSLTNYYERRGNVAAFSSLSIYREGTVIVGATGATDRQTAMQVSPEFFSTLGVKLARGRAFTEEETTYQAGGVVIVSDGYWRQRLHADPEVLGQEVRVDGLPQKVVGVLPSGFRFLSSEAQLYFPLRSGPQQRAASERHSGGGAIKMIARLGPGISIAEAQSQIDAHNAAMSVGDPEAKAMAEAGFRTPVLSLQAAQVASVRPLLLLVQSGAFFLLLIGLVNLVNLLLVRASTRAKECAVRQALGASRRHVVGEVLAETTLLAVVGGLGGLALGAGGTGFVAAVCGDQLPLGVHLSFDWRLALVAFGGAVALGAITAVPIAWFNLRAHLANALQSESRGSTAGRAAQRLRHGFVVGQIALAFVLLAGAGLLGTSLRQVMAISPGFSSGQILSGQISLPYKTYGSDRARLAFTERLIGEVGHEPGVVAAGVSTNVPFSGNGGKSSVTVVGYIRPPDESLRANYTFGVDGDYFAALGLPLVEGRFLSAADSRRTERVCVIDEAFARYYWKQGGAIGHRLYQGSQAGNESEAFTIVGVVGVAKQEDLADREALGTVYLPFGYRSDESIYVVVRSNVPSQSLGHVLQSTVRKIDPELPVNDLRSMETRIADSLVARRSPALLAVIFGGFALLLTVIGTYGVLSHAVAQRRHEIGVRMALGAQPGQIGRQFLRLGLRLLAAGMLLGLLGAWLAGNAMQSLLFGVPALHWPTLVSVCVVLIVISLGACLIPARRATKVDPMVALRSE